MAVIRVEKNGNYTTMCNQHLRSKTLSLKAKGLLSEMLSLPDTWDYSVAGLVAINAEGEKGIISTLKELKDAGYIVTRMLTPDQTGTGRIDYEYTVYEVPPKTVPPKQGDCNRGTVTGVLSQGDCNSDSVRGVHNNNREEPLRENTDIDDTYNKRVRFAPPTLEEVSAYCSERKNNIDPQYFIDYYDARGWVLSNGQKVKDWKACVRTWEKNNYGGRKQPRYGKTGVKLADTTDHELDEVFSLGSSWSE